MSRRDGSASDGGIRLPTSERENGERPGPTKHTVRLKVITRNPSTRCRFSTSAPVFTCALDRVLQQRAHSPVLTSNEQFVKVFHLVSRSAHVRDRSSSTSRSDARRTLAMVSPTTPILERIGSVSEDMTDSEVRVRLLGVGVGFGVRRSSTL